MYTLWGRCRRHHGPFQTMFHMFNSDLNHLAAAKGSSAMAPWVVLYSDGLGKWYIEDDIFYFQYEPALARYRYLQRVWIHYYSPWRWSLRLKPLELSALKGH